jgi:hypothetical protein
MLDRAELLWKTFVGAAEDPGELVRIPTGPVLLEFRHCLAAHGAYPFAVVRGNQPLKPVRLGYGVIVDERHDISARELGASITGGAKATIVFIRQNHDRYRIGRALYPKILFALPQQLIIMINAYDDLDRRTCLSFDGSDRSRGQSPTI